MVPFSGSHGRSPEREGEPAQVRIGICELQYHDGREYRALPGHDRDEPVLCRSYFPVASAQAGSRSHRGRVFGLPYPDILRGPLSLLKYHPAMGDLPNAGLSVEPLRTSTMLLFTALPRVRKLVEQGYDHNGGFFSRKIQWLRDHSMKTGIVCNNCNIRGDVFILNREMNICRSKLHE